MKQAHVRTMLAWAQRNAPETWSISLYNLFATAYQEYYSVPELDCETGARIDADVLSFRQTATVPLYFSWYARRLLREFVVQPTHPEGRNSWNVSRT